MAEASPVATQRRDSKHINVCEHLACTYKTQIEPIGVMGIWWELFFAAQGKYKRASNPNSKLVPFDFCPVFAMPGQPSTLWKPEEARCVHTVPGEGKPSQLKDIANVATASGLEPVQQSVPKPHHGEFVRQPNVAQSRMPHTTCTSIWASGEHGPLTMVFEAAYVSQKRVDAVNAKYKGRAWVMRSTTDTHFFNADTTIRMWTHCLKPAFASRRAKLGLQGKKGAVMFDAFTGNTATLKGHDAIRDSLALEMNVEILPPIPGRGSSVLQPCDQVHQHCRFLNDCAEELLKLGAAPHVISIMLFKNAPYV